MNPFELYFQVYNDIFTMILYGTDYTIYVNKDRLYYVLADESLEHISGLFRNVLSSSYKINALCT